MWADYKVFIVTITLVLVIMTGLAFLPGAKWKCPAGSGLVSEMCVPGAVPPVRQ